MIGRLWERVRGRYMRHEATRFSRPLEIATSEPIISFTFDDFPRTALYEGGGILHRGGLSATYYASLGLMGRTAPAGEIFVRDDLPALLAERHELGCHTFDHYDSWSTSTTAFERSIDANGAALGDLLPGAEFRTFSYPMSPPRPRTKRQAGERFLCCRGGGQTFNAGTADLNCLRAYFLEKSREDFEAVRQLIEQNCRARGWLILVTHDVRRDPSPYGCTPAFFQDVVTCSIDSGARILPVAGALDALRAAVVS
jgi:peptidoglycan/xylan/chitin deacetylase (PgdA/CDA1 family)